MKKRFLTLIIMTFVMTFSYAQDYSTGIGVRGGYYNGLTIKHFIGEHTAVEGLVFSRWQGIELAALYEIHANAFDVSRLNWYYGIGGHVGSYDGTNLPNSPDVGLAVGIDGILGLEYNIREIPINISIDWKPSLNIIGYRDSWGDNGAVSIRYIF